MQLAKNIGDADVVVIGAGPSGSTAAYHLARAGLDVVVLEKTQFPREKVCGDGLTPRAVRQLVDMGVELGPDAGWQRTRGVRLVSSRVRLDFDWPVSARWPDFGLVRPRTDFDELLARHAQKAGARLYEQTAAVGLTRDEQSGRVVGVQAIAADGEPFEISTRLVVAGDGVSGRTGAQVGVRRVETRPLGVAVRRYFRSDRSDDAYLEFHPEIWSGRPGASILMPGYAWVFGMGDGTSNVGVGLLNTTGRWHGTNYRKLLHQWTSTAADGEFGDVADAVGPVLGAALPMGFNRDPHFAHGVMVVGDAAGAVSPFTGEGIGYAMESGQLAAEAVVQANTRRSEAARDRALSGYPASMRRLHGGHFRLGRVFVRVLGQPSVVRTLTRHAIPHRQFSAFMYRAMLNLTDPSPDDVADRLVNAVARLTPR